MGGKSKANRKPVLLLIIILPIVVIAAYFLWMKIGAPDRAGSGSAVAGDTPGGVKDRIALASQYKHWPERKLDYVQMTALAGNNNDFGCDLYQRLVAEGENLTFSPFSISTALAMVYAGAKGNTKQQIKDVMRFDLPDEQLVKAFGDQCCRFDQVRGESHDYYEYAEELGMDADEASAGLIIGGVFTANSLWLADRFTIDKHYQRLVENDFNAKIETIDLGSAEAVRRINAWTNAQTLGQVPQVVDQGVVNDDSAVVLVSCLTLDLGWPPNDTYDVKDLPFSVGRLSKPKVPMLTKSQKYPVAMTDDFTALSMPLCSNVISLLIILPNETFGIGDVENQLTGELLADINRHLKDTETDLFLPKFKITFDCQLIDNLAVMGITDAFSPARADLTGMGTSSRGNVFIGEIIHKVSTEVNEEGVGAAAATAVIGYDSKVMFHEPPERIEFKADHPFIFLIQDTETHAVLFMGRIVNPRQSD
ncbi:serpin family protein [bacterium]|nr:serpin family protein [bacterium]